MNMAPLPVPVMSHYEKKLIMEIPFPYIRTLLYYTLTNATHDIILENALVYSHKKTELIEEETCGPTPSFFP